MVSNISIHAWCWHNLCQRRVRIMFQPVETSCSSPAFSTATSNPQPCSDIVAVSMEPRIESYRGTLFVDSYCSHSCREGQYRWGTARAECANRQSLGGYSERGVQAKSHSLCLHRSSEERALNRPQSHLWGFSNLRQLKASLEIQAESRVSLSTADRECLG